MIPVTSKNYVVFNLSKKAINKEEKFRIELMKNQLRYLTSIKKEV